MMIEFKDRLAELRKEKKWSQPKLAEELTKKRERSESYSKQTISQYERGERQPTIEIAVALAQIFDVSIGYLLGLENDRHPRLQTAREQYGLSNKAAEALEVFHNNKHLSKACEALSSMIEKGLLWAAYDISNAMELMAEINKSNSKMKEMPEALDPETIKIIDRAALDANAKERIRRGEPVTLVGEDYVIFKLQCISKSISDGVYKLVLGDESNGVR